MMLRWIVFVWFIAVALLQLGGTIVIAREARHWGLAVVLNMLLTLSYVWVFAVLAHEGFWSAP